MNGKLVANQVVDETHSTNDDAKRLAEAGYPHGTWISAKRQSSGRGRLGRKWESIEGNLFLSVIARLPEQAHWSWVPLATAVAVAETLREFHPKLGVSVKWPNDLWLDGAKLGGILCEAVGNRETSFIVIGLGLNCASAPSGLDQRAISLSEVEKGVTADDIRMAILAAILGALEKIRQEGPGFLAVRYEALAALAPGSEIEWQSSGSGPKRTAKVLGLGASGELLVVDSKGEELRLYAEDVKVRPSPSASDGSLA